MDKCKYWHFPQIIQFEHKDFDIQGEKGDNKILTAFVTFDPTSHLFCCAFCKDSSNEGAHLRVWRIGRKVMSSLKEETVEKQNTTLSQYLGGKFFHTLMVVVQNLVVTRDHIC